MGNDGKVSGWHPPMKLPEFTGKQNLAGFWMNFCGRLDSIMGATLWQVGPAPWMFMSSNTQGWFANGNWGATDGFHSSGDGTKTGTKDEAELKLEKEKKEAEEAKKKEEKKKKDFETNEIKIKFNQLKPMIEDFKKTLNERVETEFNLKKEIEECTKTINKENYEKLLKIYNDHAEVIKTAKAKEISNTVTSSKNEKYSSTIATLKSKIESGDETFGILTKTSSGTIVRGEIGVGDDKEDINIMELLSTWNTEFVGKDEHANLILHIAKNRAAKSSGEAKSKYDTLSNNLHQKLYTAAEKIQEDKLTAETKTALQKAMEDFAKFDNVAKRFPAGENPAGQNYSNAFENLYMAIRRAEAEVADKDLNDAFDFLGEENPYKNTKVNSDAVKADLEAEYRTQAQTVTEPSDPETIAKREIKHNGITYEEITENSVKKYKKGETILSEEQFKNETNITDIVFNEDGSYTFKAGGVKYKSTPDHNQSRDV